jgi:hypothetical protein
MHPGSSLVSVSINGTALTLSLLTAGLAAIRPLLLATIFSMGVVPNELTTIPLRNILAAWGMDGIIGVLTLLAALEAAAFFAGFFNDILVLLQARRQGRIHRALIARRVLMAMSNRGQEQVVNSYISRVRADIDVIVQSHRTSLIP